MKTLFQFVIAICLLSISIDLQSQSYIILDPQNFTEETGPNNTNFQFFSRIGGNWRRASFNNVRAGMLPDAVTTPIAYTPTATGNSFNKGDFVKTSANDVWYIDANGDGYLLYDDDQSGPCSDSLWKSVTQDTFFMRASDCTLDTIALSTVVNTNIAIDSFSQARLATDTLVLYQKNMITNTVIDSLVIPLPSGVSDGDKGDITVSGLAWTIDDGAVTMAKIAQAGATSGQVIKWNGAAWAPASDNVGMNALNGQTNATQTFISTDGSVSFSSSTGVHDIEVSDDGIATAKIQNDAVTMAKIAQAGATSGQVIKWNGTDWAPGNDDVGAGGGITDLNGETGSTQTFNSPNSTVTISSTTNTHSFDIANQGATSGQVLKFDGSKFSPGSDVTAFNTSLTATGVRNHTVVDNTAVAWGVSATGKSNIFGIRSTNGVEGIDINGDLSVTSFPGTSIGVIGKDVNNKLANVAIGTGLTFSGGTLSNSGDTNAADDITGSGASGRIPYFNGAQTVTSNANFNFDGQDLGLGLSVPLTVFHVENADSFRMFRINKLQFASNNTSGAWAMGNDIDKANDETINYDGNGNWSFSYRYATSLLVNKDYIKLPNKTSEPSVTGSSHEYYNTTDNRFRYRENSTWLSRNKNIGYVELTTTTTTNLDLKQAASASFVLDLSGSTGTTITVSNTPSDGDLSATYVISFTGNTGSENVVFPGNFYETDNATTLGTVAVDAFASWVCHYYPINTIGVTERFLCAKMQ